MDVIDLIRAKKQHLDRLANVHGSVGEREAVSLLTNCVLKPKGASMRTLLGALAESGIRIKASSFDAIALPAGVEVDFGDVTSVRAALAEMVFVEIKTANQSRVREDFSGFFFALTESEIEASIALGRRHRVVLFNKLTGSMLWTSVPELLNRSRSRTIQVSLQL